jgi:iron complex transport system substrate-binding protein
MALFGKYPYRIRRLAAPAVAVLVAVAGCGNDEHPSGQSTERIIPVNGDLAEVVYALGLGAHVVATDISATYPPEAAATPKVGYQRTLVAETIMSFEPTIVLADDLAGPPDVLDQLTDAGVRVVEVERQRTLDGVARKIHGVADALGAGPAGDELAARVETELDAARRRGAEAAASAGRPKVLAMYLRGENVQLVFGAGTGIDEVIDAAGGTDVGTQMGVVDNAELSIESIVAAAPDVLLVTTTGLESVGGVDGLLAMPGIDQTPAARARRVVAFEDQYLYGLGPRVGQLVAELVDAFHPQP